MKRVLRIGCSLRAEFILGARDIQIVYKAMTGKLWNSLTIVSNTKRDMVRKFASLTILLIIPILIHAQRRGNQFFRSC